jgi:hypothetical protein
LIAELDLDIDSPYPKPEVSKLEEKPNNIPYSQGDIRFLHYGRIIEYMIKAACELEDGDEKEYFTTLIVNQMKKSYITWNRSQVPDEVIINDMKLLSRGRLKMTEGVRILEVRELMPQVKKKPMGKPHNKQSNKPYNKKKQFGRR